MAKKASQTPHAGKMTFDPLQQIIIDEFRTDDYLRKHFYFTGGTALSVYYFHHRVSEDLDFFSENKFSYEYVQSFITSCESRHRFSSTLNRPEEFDILIYLLDFKNKGKLKVDFNHYPYKHIEEYKVMDGIRVDSLHDIGANKMMTINQRTEVRDFVDLYFLLKEFTIWDLLYGVEAKFHTELDHMMIATDFLKVEQFKILPKMLVPLDLDDLKSFFRQRALEIGRRITK